jgi:hypothetical protein
MREMSRRRRDAEEKLQQHLQEADHLHEEHMKAHQRDIELAHEGGGPRGYEQPAEGGAGAKPAD